MSKLFSTLTRRVVSWLGYDKDALPSTFKTAVEKYAENGAKAKVGEVESIEILHRHDGTTPVHKSSYNPKDTEDIISVRVKPAGGGAVRTHHVYSDGTGTIKKGDRREFSTSTSTSTKEYFRG